MSESPQQRTSAPQVPTQSRGAEERSRTAEPRRRADVPPPEPSGWVGWIVFASMLLLMSGAFQVISGLTAIFRSGYFVVGEEQLLVSVDFTAWGWTHIALGALAIATAVGLLGGQMWARVVGVVIALLSAVVSLGFLAAYPVWSVIVIALDVLVIYAISVHGDEAKALR